MLCIVTEKAIQFKIFDACIRYLRNLIINKFIHNVIDFN